MSSSMRNAVQRRNHRERAQPLERRRLGHLEKHKDYTLRAKDHNRKKAKIRDLQRKAADRNDDEFYFGMLSRSGPGTAATRGKSFDGKVRGPRDGSESIDVDVARLLKTQDIGYVRTVRNALREDVGRLREELVLARGGGGGEGNGAKRIVFVEGGMDEDVVGEGEKKKDETTEEVVSQERERHIKRLERDLERTQDKVKALNQAEHELEVQQAKMAKTATSGGHTRRGERIVVHKRKR